MGKKGYDPQFVKFILSDGFSRLKRLHLAFKVLLSGRYRLLLALEDLEERMVQGLLPPEGLKLAVARLFEESREIVQCLNDLSGERYLWLYAVLEHLRRDLLERLPPAEGTLGVCPMNRVSLVLRNQVGQLAARLGEVKNLLKIPVPQAVVVPLSEGTFPTRWQEEIEKVLAEWGHPATLILRLSPLKTWPWSPPKLEVPTERWEQDLARLLEKAQRQVQAWQELTGEGFSLQGAVIFQKPLKVALSGVLYTSDPFCPERPLLLVKQGEAFFPVEEDDFPGPGEVASLLLSYGETIAYHFQSPQVLEWDMEEDGKVYICQIVPLSLQHPFVPPTKGRPLRRRVFPFSTELLARYDPRLLTIWEKIVPFTLPLPESEDLAVVTNPKDFQTLQDLISFGHEAAVRELFRLEGEGPLHLLKDPRLPVVFYLLDLGQGLKQQAAFRREIAISDVRSLPLLTLWRGMTHEGVSWKGPVEFNLGGFFSVLSRSFVQTSVTREGGKGYLLVTRDYLYLRLRLAYHLMNVEAFFREGGQSYLIFRLQGGGAGAVGRQQRFLLLRDILKALGFRVEIAGDLIWALYLGPRDQELEDRLDQLGRLLGFTRQLDMTLRDENVRRRYVEAFLKGYYSVLEEPPPEED